MKRLSGLYKKVNKNKDLTTDSKPIPTPDQSLTPIEVEDSKPPEMATKDTNTETTKPEESVTTSDDKKVEESVKKIREDSIRSQTKRATIGSFSCVLFIALLSFILLDEKYLNLAISANMSSVQISSYWHKLEFVLCYQTIGISWILFNMFYVILKRINTRAIDPVEGRDDLNVLKARNIMQNSIEQFLMTAFAQIISISFIDTNLLVKVIPLVNLLFLIGRITFWLGYPKYRTFGFMCSAIPNTLLINYNLIKFIQSLFF